MHLLLRQTGDASVILLIREGVTQGYPLLMILYGITLVPLEEDLRDAGPTPLSPFYANDAAFDGLARRSAEQLRLLMYWGEDRSYFPDLAKSLFITDNPEEEETANREF